jgi:hypothetical protein
VKIFGEQVKRQLAKSLRFPTSSLVYFRWVIALHDLHPPDSPAFWVARFCVGHIAPVSFEYIDTKHYLRFTWTKSSFLMQ